MIAPLAKFIDWSVLQTGSAMFPKSLREPGPGLKLEEAVRFLKGPDFIPAESPPAKVQFDDALHFRFPTPRPSKFPENNVVYGRLYRCGERWRERPAIILLHGGVDPIHYRFGFPLIARQCNRAGFNAATLESPYHYQRRPRQYSTLGVLGPYIPLTPDYFQMAETYAQAVSEIRGLTSWLLAEGCPAVALAGVSLGGWMAGITVCRDARLAAVVVALAPARQGNILSQLEHVAGRRARELLLSRRAACEELVRTLLNPGTSRPAISREKLLLIEGIHDLLVSIGPEEIWQSWGQPEIWRLPHGHISTFFMPGLAGRIIGWLAPRLEKSALSAPR
ncbi:alpha/beta hydrolase family protein [Pedosphaera parvula]|nr:alpha/beta hydrolase family protein [Pedosphaera parvula]